MIGPRLQGGGGVSLVPVTLEHVMRNNEWMTLPEVTRFWGVRALDLRPAAATERHRKIANDETQVMWTIAYEGQQAGFTGLFDIDWIARSAESGIFVGRHDLWGRGIASEAVRLRTGFARDELALHRVHNWIAVGNLGSRRANEKVGYLPIGRYDHAWFRSGRWQDEQVAELLLPPRV